MYACYRAENISKVSGSATGSCIAVIQLKKPANNFDGKKRRKQKMQILLGHKPPRPKWGFLLAGLYVE